MEHLKRLEGEVVDLLRTELGEAQEALELSDLSVDPHQFLGLEVSPRAAQIADVVLWIGYLQWHFRTKGRVMPAEPVLKNFKNIECRDALLEWDDVELVRDDDGKPVSRWDGRTMKTDLVTGREVPDETARVELERYVNPRPAPWPKADYIVGNPPFTGGKDLRDRLGGYAEALWAAYPDMPRSADLVMYWWKRAADLVRTGKARRFGLITTNSLNMTFNRRAVDAALNAKPRLRLSFAIPDHPWYLSGGMAAIRVAMTVGDTGAGPGTLVQVADRMSRASEGGDQLREPVFGPVSADLRVGIDIRQTKPLASNTGLSAQGMKLHGRGFVVSPEKARELGLGAVSGLDKHIVEFRNGRDLTSRPRGDMVIDLYGLTEDSVRQHFPSLFQHLWQTVKPDREAKVGRSKDMAEYASKWWIFGKPRSELRPAISVLRRYAACVRVAKHLVFQFLPARTLPESRLIVFALEGAWCLGVLSSCVHAIWAIAAGGRHGVGNDPVYYPTACFDPFPFPDATEAQKAPIRELAEELDALRKRVLAEHEDLTLTGLYNVRQALIEGRALAAKEKVIHDKGCVGVIKHLHDEIDAAVADAYGWPVDLTDEQILERVVALNLERQEEEKRGLVRWLRPEYQNPAGTRIELKEQGELAVSVQPTTSPAGKPKWPQGLTDRINAVRDVLAKQPAPATAADIATAFQRKPRSDDVAEVLSVLAAFGQARLVGKDRFAP